MPTKMYSSSSIKGVTCSFSLPNGFFFQESPGVLRAKFQEEKEMIAIEHRQRYENT